MQVHITMKSSNAKTGPIPVSTSSKETCPSSCSLKDNGCYASSGPLALHWNKVTSGERGTDWNTFCDTVATMPEGQVWRHNQAGDLPMHANGEIDAMAMVRLVRSNKGKRGFTYTHHDMSIGMNAEIVDACNTSGFTINLSAESLLEADKLHALGIGPVVTLIPETDVKTLTTQAGNHVVVCPATYRDDVSCATCQLCQRQRSSIVAFPVHGTSKKKAHKVFMMKNVTQ